MDKKQFSELFVSFMFPVKQINNSPLTEKEILLKIWNMFNYIELSEKKEFLIEKIKNETANLYYLILKKREPNLTFSSFTEKLKIKILSTMIDKEYYGSDNDRLYSFSYPSEKTGLSMSKICWGYMLKHLSLISRFIENPVDFAYRFSVVESAFVDFINYCGILFVISRYEEEMYYAGQTETAGKFISSFNS